jgi:hypothetical protein
MGLGKTLVVLAAHALEQHTLPEEAEMHTEHSVAALAESETVYVGRRYPDEPQREKLKEVQMHTGFKQLQRGAWHIVPDGSVRRNALYSHDCWQLPVVRCELLCSARMDTIDN